MTDFDLESVSTHDANVAHIEYFNSEYYLDDFLPNYWKNPFIKEFNHSEGNPEDDDMFAWAGLEFYQPEDGYLCYVDFLKIHYFGGDFLLHCLIYFLIHFLIKFHHNVINF